MRVLIDTCIWSRVFRYKDPVLADSEYLRQLVEIDKAMIIGPIRQEFLSGIKEIGKYKKFIDDFRSFQDLPMTTEIFESAAFMFNECSRHGISASSVAMMICAAAKKYNLEIWTIDPDFNHYKKFIDIKLHKCA
jgi:predicted nucleic acid-binding protein